MVCRKAATSGLSISSPRKGEEVCATLWWTRGLHLLQALAQARQLALTLQAGVVHFPAVKEV